MAQSDSPVRSRRSAMRQSVLFDDFPLVARPAYAEEPFSPALGGVAWEVAQLLALRFPPKLRGPFTPMVARCSLSQWGLDVSDLIAESSRNADIDERLSSPSDLMVTRMQRWLDGHWSDDADALERLCWHLELSRSTISAVLWLHRFGRFHHEGT